MSPATKEALQKVQVLGKVVNSDLTKPRDEYLFRTPLLATALSPLLKDQRDMPMLCLQLNILTLVPPAIALVYAANLWEPALPLWLRHAIGLLYYVPLLLTFQERFTLMLHFASHRSIFHSDLLNSSLNWVFAPFFGIPCGVYKLHHVIMHHIENNHGWDISSTEGYQRDSWFSFFRYWLHFVVFIWVELPHFALRSNRFDKFQQFMAGMVVWTLTIFLLAKYVSFVATLWVFIVPHVAAMSAMAFGNWSQHIFVDPKNPTSNFSLTYNCIDSATNQRTFNDGYHVIHHMNARLHWSEMPEYFYQQQEKHLKEGAITFRELHFFEVGVLVMTKRLRKLAEHFVHLGTEDSAPTVDAVEAKLRSWLVPVPAELMQRTKAA